MIDSFYADYRAFKSNIQVPELIVSCETILYPV